MWHHVVYPTCLHKWWKQHSFLHIGRSYSECSVYWAFWAYWAHMSMKCINDTVSSTQKEEALVIESDSLKEFWEKKSHNCHSWNAKKNLHRVVSKVLHLSHLQWESRKRKNLPHSDLEVGSLLVAQYRSYCWMSLKEKPGHPNFWRSCLILEGASLTGNPLLTEVRASLALGRAAFSLQLPACLYYL